MAEQGLHIGIKILGLNKAKRKLQAAKREVRKTRPLFDKAIIVLEQIHTKTFRIQGRPRWKPSKRAEAQGGMTLQDTGRLRGSVTGHSRHAIREVRGNKLIFGTNLLYAPSHQYGYPPRNIPKRAFLGVYPDDVGRLTKIMTEDLDERITVVTTVG